MEYAVYFKWLDDGTEDSFNVEGKKELDLNIKSIQEDDKLQLLSVSKIYKSGEYVELRRMSNE